MGIKNLPRRLNEAGKIKIGGKGEKKTSLEGKEFFQPERYDHFIITTTERDEDGKFITDENLMETLSLSGQAIVNQAGNLTGLPVRLLYNDTDLNFPTRYASYVSGRLSCSGDGEKAEAAVMPGKVKACPCERLDQKYEGKDKCKPNGTLTCIIDQSGFFGQAHKFRTTSINSVFGIIGGIDLIKTATGGRIAGLPLMLMINNKSTVTPQGQNTTIQVVSICYRGSMMTLRNKAIELLEEEKQYLLSMDAIEAEAKNCGAGVIVPENEEKEFSQEFFPGNNQENPPQNAMTETGAISGTPEEKAISTVSVPASEPAEEPVKLPGSLSNVLQDDLILKQEQAKPADITPESEKQADEDHEPDVKPGYERVDDVDMKKLDPFLDERDPEKAIKIIEKFKKPSLIWILKLYYPDIQIPEKGKRAVFLGLLSACVRETLPIRRGSQSAFAKDSPEKQEQDPFITKLISIENTADVIEEIQIRWPNAQINRTLHKNGLILFAQRFLEAEKTALIEKSAEVKTKTECEKPAQANQQELHRMHDDGPAITVDQKRELVRLKKEKGLIDAVWNANLLFFKGADGQPIDTALKLTEKQADYFIQILKDEVIPF